MQTRLIYIDELFNYDNINEYITINHDLNSTTKYKIKRTLLNKPNYQLFTENSGIITLAYSQIPDYLNFYVENKTLIKVISTKNKTNKIVNELSIDVKLVNNDYDCKEDEETVNNFCD